VELGGWSGSRLSDYQSSSPGRALRHWAAFGQPGTVCAILPYGGEKSSRRHSLCSSLAAADSRWYGGADALNFAADDQGPDRERVAHCKTAAHPCTNTAGDRHCAASLRRTCGGQIVSKAYRRRTAIILVLVLWLYGKGMVNSMGDLAIGAQLLFLYGMALLSYLIGFGLKQEQRSSMALGMGTRNIAAVFAVLMAIPHPDSRLVVMNVLVVPLSVIVAFVAARLFATRAGGTVVERAA
jgi:hypothetical protein